jgi:hypothetical protein
VSKNEYAEFVPVDTVDRATKALALWAKAQGVKTDPRVAVLGVVIKADFFRSDPTLGEDEFRIIIGPRGAAPKSR